MHGFGRIIMVLAIIWKGAKDVHSQNPASITCVAFHSKLPKTDYHAVLSARQPAVLADHRPHAMEVQRRRVCPPLHPRHAHARSIAGRAVDQGTVWVVEKIPSLPEHSSAYLRPPPPYIPTIYIMILQWPPHRYPLTLARCASLDSSQGVHQALDNQLPRV
jgi:hypothetical protein